MNNYKFNYEGLSVTEALEELECLGTKVLDLAIDRINNLQSIGVDIHLRGGYANWKEIQAYYKVYYKDMHEIQSRIEVRHRYFKDGRLYKLLCALSDFKTNSYLLLNSGEFKLDDCLNAMDRIKEMELILSASGTFEFSEVYDKTNAFIEQLATDFENISEIFPKMQIDMDPIEFNKKFLADMSAFISAFKIGLVGAAIRCIDESLREKDIFIDPTRLSSLLQLRKNIPDNMIKEKKAILYIYQYIAENIKDETCNVLKIYSDLAIHLNKVSSAHEKIDNISTFNEYKVTRLKYYFQSVDKGNYFYAGLCSGAARSLIRYPISKKVAAAIRSDKKFKYSDIHNFAANYNICDLQNTHSSMVLDFPEFLDVSVKTYNIRKFDTNELEEPDCFLPKLASSIFNDLKKYSQREFNADNNVGPRIYVNLMDKSSVGHLVVFQKCKGDGSELFYRFIDYNSGEFIIPIIENEEKEMHTWFATYLLNMGYDVYYRYKITVEYTKKHTLQDTDDFKFRSTLRELFANFDDAIHVDDYYKILQQIISVYNKINARHLYDDYAVWLRISYYLNDNIEIYDAQSFHNKLNFCMLSFKLLDRCNEHLAFRPMYKPHKFSVLKDVFFIVLHSKNNRSALKCLEEMIKILSYTLSKSNIEADAFISYLKSIDNITSLRKHEDLQTLKEMIKALSDNLYEKKYNTELAEFNNIYQDCKGDGAEIEECPETWLFNPSASSDYTFYYTPAFNKPHTIKTESSTSLVLKRRYELRFVSPLFNKFLISPVQNLMPNSDFITNGRVASSAKTNILAICDAENNMGNSKSSAFNKLKLHGNLFV